MTVRALLAVYGYWTRRRPDIVIVSLALWFMATATALTFFQEPSTAESALSVFLGFCVFVYMVSTSYSRFEKVAG